MIFISIFCAYLLLGQMPIMELMMPENAEFFATDLLSQFSTVYNAQGPLTTESPEAPFWHSNGLSAMVGTGCVLTGLLLAVNWGDPGWWRHGIVCSLPHSSPFSKRHPTQRGQQFQNFPAHFLPPPTKIASDHTKFAYSPVRATIQITQKH